MSVILICDDDDGILNMLRVMFEFEGFNVIAHNDSSKIFNLIKKRLPDLIIIDLWMPIVPGYEVITSVKSDPLTSVIPVIAISASIDGYSNAKAAGANEFIAKPFDIEFFMSVVNALLSSFKRG